MSISIGRGGISLSGGRGGYTWVPEFDLWDDFITTEAAPLASPRTCEPGPGTLTGSGDLSTTSIVDGKYTVAAGNASTAAFATSIARAIGLAVVAKHRSSAVRTTFSFDVSNRVEVNQLFFLDGSVIAMTNLSSDVDYNIAWIARSAGVFLAVRGGVWTNWTLFWAAVAGSGNVALSIGQINTAGACTFDTLRVLDLPAPFSTDYGIATNRIAGAVSAGATFVHEADCLIEWVATNIGSAGNTYLDFRIQNSTNLWRILVNSAGALVLREVVDGVSTDRATALGVIANGDRIVVIADGTTIRVYEANTLRIAYASATNFATATAGSLATLGTGGAVSDIVAWPRTLSGQAKTLLDAAIDA